MKLRLSGLAFFFFLVLGSGFVRADFFCPQELEAMPILAHGRVKPLKIHAEEVLKFITGSTVWEGRQATENYCRASFAFLSASDFEDQAFPLKISHMQTRKILKMNEEESQISYQEALAQLDKLEAMAMRLSDKERQEPANKDILATIEKIRLYEKITEGDDWVVPFLRSENQVDWASIKSMKSIQGDESFSQKDLVDRILQKGNEFSEKIDNSFQMELLYQRLHLLSWATVTALLALGLVFVSLKKGFSILGVVVVGLTLCLEVTALIFRMLISGRAPVTNMYETVLWAGLVGLAVSLIFSFFKRDRVFYQVGLILNLVCLFMLTFSTTMFDPTIRPLVPVLRDNFWLSTHVTCITLSYAVLALSWFLANGYLVVTLFKKTSSDFKRRTVELCYHAIKVGVVFLAAGIILGAVWADYSWGRFWGWDPKETWSLITFVTYMIILHGRFSGWINQDRFILLTAGAYLTTLMTWFGVNYILMAGLHSYGFSEGGALFLAVIFVVQSALMLMSGIRESLRQRSHVVVLSERRGHL